MQARDRRGLQLAHERRERIDVLVGATGSAASAGSHHRSGHRPRAGERYESARAIAVDLAAFTKRQRDDAVVARDGCRGSDSRGPVGRMGGSRSAEGESEPVTRPARGPRHLAASFGGPEVDPVENPVIVVLPFENLSPDGRQGLLRRRAGGRDPAQPGGDRGAAGALAGILVCVQGQAPQPARHRAANLPPTCSSRAASARRATGCGSTFNWPRSAAPCCGPINSIGSSRTSSPFRKRLRGASSTGCASTLGRGQRRYDIDVASYEMYLKARELQASRGARRPARQSRCSKRS